MVNNFLSGRTQVAQNGLGCNCAKLNDSHSHVVTHTESGTEVNKRLHQAPVPSDHLALWQPPALPAPPGAERFRAV